MTKPFKLPWRKRILKSPWFQDITTWLLALLLKLFSVTYRFENHIAPESRHYFDGEDNAIFCFWHGRMIVFPLLKPKNRPMDVLISQHRDGELIAKVVRHFRVKAIRGSSSKGGAAATKQLLQIIEQGHNIAITPDGPRGPFQKASPGAAYLARLSGKPLIPATFSASSSKRLRSWDKFMIPLPFSRIVVEVGPPISVGKDKGKEALTECSNALEQTLSTLTQKADEQMKAIA